MNKVLKSLAFGLCFSICATLVSYLLISFVVWDLYPHTDEGKAFVYSIIRLVLVLLFAGGSFGFYINNYTEASAGDDFYDL